MNVWFAACGFTALLFVTAITVFLVISGTPAISEIGLFNFLFGRVWNASSNPPEYGILAFLLSSVYGTFGAVLIGVPTGVMCAVFLAKRRGSAADFIRSAVGLMSGIPSVVYGLIGMTAVVPTVRRIFSLADGANLFSAIIVLSVMILPNVIAVSETAIRAVPKEYSEAALALGATQTEAMFGIVLPAAKSGIITSAALGFGRAIGEAMAVMMVSGNVANMPSLFGSVRFLTTAVASEMSYSSGLQRQALFSVALVLFLFITLINLVVKGFAERTKLQKG
jgi:phosphate transport system permease protein